MAAQPSTVDSSEPPPTYLEVNCKISGKKSRFAPGTKAGFAVSLFNRKLHSGNSFVSHIEAVKEGEEPISFGPNAVLVDYGCGWKLRTVYEADYGGTKNGEFFRRIPTRIPAAMEQTTGLNLAYIGKIFIAFVMMFVFGAIFTFALENLPSLILLINSAL